MGDKCEKHDEVIGRVFDRINENGNQLTSINTKMDEIKDFKDMIREVIFGNGKPGLKDKVYALARQITLQWFLLGVIIGAVVNALARHVSLPK